MEYIVLPYEIYTMKNGIQSWSESDVDSPSSAVFLIMFWVARSFPAPGHPGLGELCPPARALINLWRLGPGSLDVITHSECLTSDFSEGSPSRCQVLAAASVDTRLTSVCALGPGHAHSHTQPVALSNLSIFLSPASLFLAVISLLSGNAKTMRKVIFLLLWWEESKPDWRSDAISVPTQWNSAVGKSNSSAKWPWNVAV